MLVSRHLCLFLADLRIASILCLLLAMVCLPLAVLRLPLASVVAGISPCLRLAPFYLSPDRLIVGPGLLALIVLCLAQVALVATSSLLPWLLSWIKRNGGIRPGLLLLATAIKQDKHGPLVGTRIKVSKRSTDGTSIHGPWPGFLGCCSLSERRVQIIEHVCCLALTTLILFLAA